jgi:FKBP-type peptidyl-prolyl cis-trans isomerase
MFAGLAAVWLLTACGENVEVVDQRKREENEQQISQYLAANGIQAERTASGLYYLITEPHPDSIQATVDVYNQLTVAYSARLLGGTTPFDSAPETSPYYFALGDTSVLSGFREGVSLMRKGEKARLFINSYLAYRGQVLDGIPAYSPLEFDVHLMNVRSEDQVLQEYIRDSSYTAIPLENGLYFVEKEAGQLDEPPPAAGHRVTINYSAYFPSGRLFDSANNFTFTVDAPGTTNNPIPAGLNEGVKRMRPGGLAIFLMPSALGFEATGSRVKRVPPYQPLVYRVRLNQVQIPE